MSAQAQSPPIHGALGGGVIVAIVAAVTVGALAGSMITQAIMDRDNAVPTAAGVVSWDAGKLEAMEGRQLAEQFRAEAGPIVSWDAGKLEAMEGRQLAEQFRAQTSLVVPWDAGKLEAMEGRQLAEEIVFGTGS